MSELSGMASVTILDYGMGNLRSVQKGLEKVGATALITSDPDQVASADRLILPGVGAFRDAIAALRDQHLAEPVLEHIRSGRPFLGICLGMQLLLTESHEDGLHQGLNVVEGAVRKFEVPAELKVPHMGWNQLQDIREGCPLFSGVRSDAWFYFVHSYYVDPSDDSWTIARTDYGGAFTSVIGRDNVFATQFHPEKSQTAGLQLLKNFSELS